LSELRYALRSLSKRPSFTVVAVLSLALGIGINTGIYALTRAVLLDPLPVPNPESLVAVGWNAGPDARRSFLSINSTAYRDENARGYNSNFSYQMYRAFERVAGREICAFSYAATDVNVAAASRSIAASNLLVSGNFFSVIEVATVLGRPLTPSDDRPDAPPAAVLTYNFWIHAFGGDPKVLGQSIRVDGLPFTVVGVTSPGFYGMSKAGPFFRPTDILLPLSVEPLVYTRSVPRSLFNADDKAWVQIMMRLPPDAAHAPVDAALTATFRHMVGSSPIPDLHNAAQSTVRVFRAPRGLDSWSRPLEQPLFLLGVTAVIVLVIASVNVGNLMLVRSLTRQKELAIRVALGSTSWRLVRGTLVEALVIAAAGGAFGIVAGIWSARALAAMLIADAGNTAVRVGVGPRLIAATAAFAILAGLLFGALPALKIARGRFAPTLKDVAIGVSGRSVTAGRILMSAQVAVSLPLLVGGVLFLRTVYNLGHVALGFDPDRLLIFRLDPTINGYGPERIERLYDQVIARLDASPGVAQATITDLVLLSRLQNNWPFVAAGGAPRQAKFARVGADYFGTFGIPLVAGRTISSRDGSQAPRVAVLNEAAAQMFFPATQPLGQHLTMQGSVPAEFEVVGIVRNSRYTSPRDPMPPIVYLPYGQTTFGALGAMNVVVRTEVPPSAAVAEVRSALAAIDPNIPLTQLKTQADQIDETLGTERTFMRLLIAFGGFALLLAGIGLHGLTAYSVVRRTSEIGVRVALGAQRVDVLWLMLRQVIGITIAGLAIGIPAALASARVVRASLYGVEPTDVASIAAAAAVMIVAALTAALFPALRATRLDPLIALRQQA